MGWFMDWQYSSFRKNRIGTDLDRLAHRVLVPVVIPNRFKRSVIDGKVPGIYALLPFLEL